VPLTLILRNVSDRPVEVGLGSRPETGFERDFVVSTSGGVKVWGFGDDKVWYAVLWPKTLNPAQQLMLEGEWNQVDAQGAPVAAGNYLVRGFLPIRLDVNTPAETGLTLQTEAKPLVILPE
jgi:hypothetical protein